MLEKDFKKIIGNIKEEILNAQIKTMQQVNSNLIMLYFRLGKIVSENKKYGNNFTRQVSIELKINFSKHERLFRKKYKINAVILRRICR